MSEVTIPTAEAVDAAQRVWEMYHDEGVLAGRQGCGADECPYPFGIRRIAWYDGWSEPWEPLPSANPAYRT